MAEPTTTKDSVLTKEESLENKFIELPEGFDFTLESASEIMRTNLTRVIVFAGPPNSGKTTVINSIYDSFQQGPVGGYLFSGSSTFPGLERRCHPSRIASNASSADTTRTPYGEGNKLLHFKIRKEDLSSPCQDLLITDFSGEYFKEAINSTEACKKLKAIKRADHFVLFLDCEKLANAQLRHGIINEGKALLRSLIEAEMLGKFSIVNIFFSKYDKKSPDFHEIENKIKTEFDKLKPLFGNLVYYQIISKPIKEAHGIKTALKNWVEESYLFSLTENDTQESMPQEAREIIQFSWKKTLNE